MGTDSLEDLELFDLMRRKLFSAVIGDVLDTMGLRRQFLPPEIKPLRDDMIVVGRAMPVLEVDLSEEADSPFGKMLQALDDLKRGEIYVAAGAKSDYALWGELMSCRAIKLGASGAILDGYSRDTRGILALNFPAFSRGRYAQDQKPRGQVVDFRVGVQIGQARIAPGDLLYGDLDGVLVIPRAAEAEAVRLALEKVEKESLVRTAIERDGMTAAKALQTFGVL